MYVMAYAVQLLANTVHQMRLLIYMIGYVVHLMVNPVHLLANAVHPSEAPDEHDRICGTLDCRCSTPKWAPDVLYMLPLQYTWWQMQCTQVGLLKYSMASAVHLMANVVHPVLLLMLDDGICSTPVRLLIYMMAYATSTCLANTVHQVRFLIYMIGYVEHLMVNPVYLLANAVHPSEAPDEHERICCTLDCKCSIPRWGSWCTVHDCLYSTLDGKCSTPKWGSWSTARPLQHTWWLML